MNKKCFLSGNPIHAVDICIGMVDAKNITTFNTVLLWSKKLN